MTKPTGSVYLDAPRRTRRPPVPRVSNARTVAGGLLVVIGLTGLTVATTATLLRVLVLEPDPVVDAFEAGFDDPEARAEIEGQIAMAIEDGFVGADLAEIADVWGVDIAAEARAVSGAVADDPAFRSAFTDLVTEVHRRALVERDESDLDLAPVSDAALVTIRRESSALAALIPDGSTLWTLGGDEIPDLTVVGTAFDRVLMLSLVASLGLAGAIAVHPRRHRVAVWVGRWFLISGLLAALLAIGLPPLAGHLTGWHTVETAVRSTTTRLLPPAGLAGMVGIGLVSFAALARRREARRVKREGANAALGWDEPAPWTHPQSPDLELAQRGLVDASRPLTNI